MQLRRLVPNDVKRMIYISKLQYGIIAWEAVACKINLKLITNSRKKFLKILFNKPKRLLFQGLDISTVEELHQIYDPHSFSE